MAEVYDRTQLRQFQAIFEMGFNRCAESAGLLKPFISQNKAEKMYGSGNVKKWITAGLVTPIRDGKNTSAWRIRRQEIEQVAVTYNPECWPSQHL